MKPFTVLLQTYICFHHSINIFILDKKPKNMDVVSYDHNDDKYLIHLPIKLFKIPDSKSYANCSRTKGTVQTLM